MAKGDVTLKFDANTAQAIQEILKCRAALESLAETSRKTGEHVSKMSEAISGAAEAIFTIPTAAAAGGMAVEYLMKTADAYFQKIEQKAEHMRQLTATLSEAMANAGHTADYPTIAGNIKGMSGGNFSEAELSRVAARVYGEVGSVEATPARIAASLQAYQKGREGSMSEEGATDLAVQYARLSEAGLQDKAMQAHVAKLDEGDMRVFKHAGSTAAALGMIIAAHGVDEGPKGLEKIDALAGLAGEDPKHLTNAERIQRRKLLAAMNGGTDPYAAILSHPELGGDEHMAAIIRNVARGAANLNEHPMASLEDQIKATQASLPLALQRFERGTAVIGEQRMETPLAQYYQAREDLENRVNEDMRKSGILTYLRSKVISGGEDEANQQQFEPEMYWRSRDLFGKSVSASGIKNNKELGESISKSAQQHLEELRKINNSIDRLGRNSTLSNDTEGQK